MPTITLSFRRLGSGRWPEWVRDLRGASGAYIIRDAETDEMLYVGESHTGRLYETLTRHFQHWSGYTAGPTYYRGRVSVAVVPTDRGQQAVEIQNALIRRFKPADNTYGQAPEDEVPF